MFAVHAVRNNIAEAEQESKRAEFFAKGQACLRASPLGKIYGWGIHFDGLGRIALYGRASNDYARFKRDDRLKHLNAMKSSR